MLRKQIYYQTLGLSITKTQQNVECQSRVKERERDIKTNREKDMLQG